MSKGVLGHLRAHLLLHLAALCSPGLISQSSSWAPHRYLGLGKPPGITCCLSDTSLCPSGLDWTSQQTSYPTALSSKPPHPSWSHLWLYAMVSLGCTCGPQWCNPHPCPRLRAVPGLTAAVMESGMVGTDPGFHDPGDVSRRKVGGEGSLPSMCRTGAGS